MVCVHTRILHLIVSHPTDVSVCNLLFFIIHEIKTFKEGGGEMSFRFLTTDSNFVKAKHAMSLHSIVFVVMCCFHAPVLI